MEEERSYLPIPTNNPISMEGSESLAHDYKNSGGGVIRYKRDTPPANFTLKIESYSFFNYVLTETGNNNCQTQTFEAGGSKWKLSLFPNGHPQFGHGHISLYLVLEDGDALPPHKEVIVDFKLFLHNQLEDKYLCVQDCSETNRRFHYLKTQCGFSQFIPLAIFNDASNGYLVNDSCSFGAEVSVFETKSEVSVVETKSKMECFSKVLDPGGHSDICTWKLTFSELAEECYCSEWFNSGGRRWRMVLYPRGKKKNYVSLYLELEKPKTNSNIRKRFQGWFKRDSEVENLFVQFKLCMKNQGQGQNVVKIVSRCFDDENYEWGVKEFMLLDDLKDPSKGYVVNDTLILQAELSRIYAEKTLYGN